MSQVVNIAYLVQVLAPISGLGDLDEAQIPEEARLPDQVNDDTLFDYVQRVFLEYLDQWPDPHRKRACDAIAYVLTFEPNKAARHIHHALPPFNLDQCQAVRFWEALQACLCGGARGLGGTVGDYVVIDDFAEAEKAAPSGWQPLL